MTAIILIVKVLASFGWIYEKPQLPQHGGWQPPAKNQLLPPKPKPNNK